MFTYIEELSEFRRRREVFCMDIYTRTDILMSMFYAIFNGDIFGEPVLTPHVISEKILRGKIDHKQVFVAKLNVKTRA